MAQHDGNRVAHDQGNRVAQYSGNQVAQDGGNSTAAPELAPKTNVRNCRQCLTALAMRLPKIYKIASCARGFQNLIPLHLHRPPWATAFRREQRFRCGFFEVLFDRVLGDVQAPGNLFDANAIRLQFQNLIHHSITLFHAHFAAPLG